MRRAVAFAASAPPQAVIRDGMVHIGKAMSLSASRDRRMIDGVTGAKFLARHAELIENPGELLA